MFPPDSALHLSSLLSRILEQHERRPSAASGHPRPRRNGTSRGNLFLKRCVVSGGGAQTDFMRRTVGFSRRALFLITDFFFFIIIFVLWVDM